MDEKKKRIPGSASGGAKIAQPALGTTVATGAIGGQTQKNAQVDAGLGGGGKPAAGEGVAPTGRQQTAKLPTKEPTAPTAAPTAPATPTATQPKAPAAPATGTETPQGRSFYDMIIDLYRDGGGKLPEGHNYSRQIDELYAGMQGKLPENRDFSPEISELYDRARDAQLAQLQGSYDQVVRALDAAGEKIPAAYQQQGNALAGEYERQRAAMNEQMAASGLNTGAGSQARLAQNAGYLSSAAQIKQAQADAAADLARERASKEAEYQNAITAALRDNDYQRAIALTQELKDYQSRAMQIAQMGLGIEQSRIGAQTSELGRQAAEQMQMAQMGRADDQERRQAEIAALTRDQDAALEQAKIRAGYGDFSGFAQLYGDEAARQMQALWQAQNPQFAYMTGALTAEQYRTLTGQYPVGYQTPGTGYGYAPTEAAPAATQPQAETTPLREVPGTTGAAGTQGQTETAAPGSGVGAQRVGAIAAAIAGARTPQAAMQAFQQIPQSTLDAMTKAEKDRLYTALQQAGLT